MERSGETGNASKNGREHKRASAHLAAELALQPDKKADADGHTQPFQDREKGPLLRVIDKPLHFRQRPTLPESVGYGAEE